MKTSILVERKGLLNSLFKKVTKEKPINVIHKKLESCGNKIKKHTVNNIVSIVALHRFKTLHSPYTSKNAVLFDEKEVNKQLKNPSDDFKQFRDSVEHNILENGICPIEIGYVCMYYRISHYCIDFQGKLLLRYVGPNKTKSLCYLTDGEHMYPIHDTKQIREISHLPEGGSLLQIKKKEMSLKKMIQDKLKGYRRDDKKHFKTSGNITVEDVKKLLKDQNSQCWICGEKVLINKWKPYCCYQFSIDRIDDTKPHNKDNCKIACYYCNCRHHPDFNQHDKICSQGCHTIPKKNIIKRSEKIKSIM